MVRHMQALGRYGTTRPIRYWRRHAITIQAYVRRHLQYNRISEHFNRELMHDNDINQAAPPTITEYEVIPNPAAGGMGGAAYHNAGYGPILQSEYGHFRR